MEDFDKPKIVWASVGETYYSLVENATMLLDTNYFFATNKTNVYYLLGILNSSLITFWINSEDTKIGDGGAYRHYKYNLEKISIPMLQNVAPIEDSMLQILKCLKEGKDIAEYECELNKQVFRIYKLTPDEIKFIESQQSL